MTMNRNHFKTNNRYNNDNLDVILPKNNRYSGKQMSFTNMVDNCDKSYK